jgi:hypothetical protein
MWSCSQLLYACTARSRLGNTAAPARWLTKAYFDQGQSLSVLIRLFVKLDPQRALQRDEPEDIVVSQQNASAMENGFAKG